MKRIDVFLKNIDSSDLVMSRENWRTYTYDRLKWKKSDNSKMDNYELKHAVNSILIHNAMHDVDVSNVYKNIKPITLAVGWEKAFFNEKDGKLHIAQPASNSRKDRFEDMIYTGGVLSSDDWKVELESLLLDNDRQTTSRQYGNNAYDFIKKVSLDNNKLIDIDYVVIGPTNWFEKNTDKDTKIILKSENNYLNYMISEIKGKKVLNLNYVFSDQAEEIVRNLLINYHNETPEAKQPRRKIHVLMYGKAGGIRPPQKINQIVAPNGIISDYDIEHKNNNFTKLQNVFCKDDNDMNFILNSVSIPLQRKSILLKGQAKGCSITEMEALYATNTINIARSKYKNLEIAQGFLVYLSDTPLDGITLAKNPDQKDGRKACVEKVIDYIRKN